jgi:hypothetical protein
MRGNDWLALELIRGVSDAELQKKLLQEQEPSLQQLVRIAEQWQAADSAQTAFGTEATEFVRQTCTEEELEETEYIRKASNYKREINERWKSDGRATGNSRTVGRLTIDNRVTVDRHRPTTDNRLKTERPTLTDVRAVEPKERECIAEKHAPRSTVNASNAVSSAITEESAGKTKRGLIKKVTSDKRWYVQQKRTGVGAPILPP